MLPLPKGAVWQALLVLCMVLLVREAQAEVRVVCYYTNWSVYRPGTAKFNPQNINPYLCTHLIYAFGGFTKDNTLKPFDKYQDIEQGGYAKFTGLKSYNKQLKTLLAIGGWNEASSRFSPLVANPERRHQFIRNVLKFLRQNHFDGLDLDWEYPAFRDGGKPRDRDNYAQFVEELRSEFDRESQKTGRPRLLLTMAVPAGIEYIEKGYDIPKLNKYLDWFNILSYDYHSAFEPSVNHHAPLYSLEEPSEYNYDVELNIDYTVKFYLQVGADRDKLVLGIPTYGRSYTLINEEDTAIGAPADGPGEQGDATREKGYLAYYEICQKIRDDPEWTVVQPNENAMGPYAHRGDQWVNYDDEPIVRKKAEYVAENGLGGIMFWSLDNDDFRGTCSGKPYPLIEAAKEALLEALGSGANEVAAPSRPKKPSRSRSRTGSSSTRNRVTEETRVSNSAGKQSSSTSSKRRNNNKRTSTTAARSTTTTESSLYIGGRTTTPAPPTTPDPGADFKCEEEGFFPHPRDCKKYFWCLDSGPSNLGIVAHQFTCPSGLYFNTAADSCDFTRNVLCKNKVKEAATSKVTAATTTTTPSTTTQRSRAPITAATSSYSYIQRTSTTAEPFEDDDEEYIDEDEAGQSGTHEEEDPKVIKELIDLIKRVGGLEELEKQLTIQEDGSVVTKGSKASQITTTPSSISQSLYAKVLKKSSSLSALRNRLNSSNLKLTSRKEDSESSINEENSSGTKYTSVNRNSRPGPQNAGIDKLAETEGFLKEKPKYVTISRPRPAAGSDTGADEEEEEEESEAGEGQSGIDVEEDASEATQRKTSTSYVNIRRSRPTKPTNAAEGGEEVEEEDNKTSSKTVYKSINRVRGTTSSIIEDEAAEEAEDTSSTRPKSTYQTLSRNRGSTIQSTENSEDAGQSNSKTTYQTVVRNRVSVDEVTLNNEEQVPSARPTYQSFTRGRSTTLADVEEEDTDNETKVSSKSSYKPRTTISPGQKKTRGTTVSTSDVASDDEDAQKKTRLSLFSRRGSSTTAAEEEIEVRIRGTTAADADEEEGNSQNSTGSNKFKFYDRTRGTTAGLTESSVEGIEGSQDDDTIPTITVQYSDSSLFTTTSTQSPPKQEQESTARAYTNIARSSSSSPPSLSNAQVITTTTTAPEQLPETVLPDLEPVEATHASLSELSSLEPATSTTLSESEISTSTKSNDATSSPLLPAKASSQNEILSDEKPAVAIATTASSQDVKSISTATTTTTVPTDLKPESAGFVIDSDTNRTDQDHHEYDDDDQDKVTLTQNQIDYNTQITEGTNDSKLTKSNFNTQSESSLNTVNTESSKLSSLDSALTKTRQRFSTTTTTNTTPKPSASTRPDRPNQTNRFNIRRRTSTRTTTRTSTTSEEPAEPEVLISSPRPFSLPRRRTRPQLQQQKQVIDSSSNADDSLAEDNNQSSGSTATAGRTRPTAATKKNSSRRRGGSNQVNSPTAPTSTTTANLLTTVTNASNGVRNATTTVINGRRVAVLRVRRPTNRFSSTNRTNSNSNVGGGSGGRTETGDLDDDAIDEPIDNRDTDKTRTDTATKTESSENRRPYARRKLIRKRPVSSTTVASIVGEVDEQAGVSNSTVPSVETTPARRFRKVIRRKLRPLVNTTTTVTPVFKHVKQDDGRVHLLKVGEKEANRTVEEEDIASHSILVKKEKVVDAVKSVLSGHSIGSTLLKNISDISDLSERNATETIVDDADVSLAKTNVTKTENRSTSTTESIELVSPISDRTEINQTSLSQQSVLQTATNATGSEEQSASNETSTEASVVLTTKPKLFASRRPYKPTKPSISAITSTESTSSTTKSYVRKYSTNFTSIKTPSEVDNPVAIIAPKVPSILKKNRYRLKSTTARTTSGHQQIEEEEGEYEEYDDELEEEHEDDAPHRIALIKPNYVLINRKPKVEPHLDLRPGQEVEDEEEEDDDEDEPHIHDTKPGIINVGLPPALIPSTNPLNLLHMVLLPTQLPQPIPTQNLQTATESGTVVRLNNGFVGVLQKSESSRENDDEIPETTPSTTTTRRLPNNYRVTRPSNKPRVVNRPYVTTLHPASLRLSATSPPRPTTPAPFRSNGTRNYERKYTSVSSTESTLQDNSLLEELNIDALNARNKKIFQQTSKKHTTVKPKTTLKDQFGVEYNITTNTNDTESFNNYTIPHDTESEGVKFDANAFNQFQENVLEESLNRPATPVPITSTTSKLTTLHHIFELSQDDATTERQQDGIDDQIQVVGRTHPFKLVEINRIVEIYSKENVFRYNTRNHTTQNISSSELKLEKPPTLDHLGEINRVSLVNLIDSSLRSHDTKSPSSEVVIEGRSSVTGLKSANTESTPVRNSVPDYQDDQAAAGEKTARELFVPDVLAGVETSTISLQGLFDLPRKSKSGRVINSPVYATSLGEVPRPVIREIARDANFVGEVIPTAATTTTTSTTILTTTELPTLTTTVTSDISTTTSTTPISTTLETTTTSSTTERPARSANYVRSLVPLLRPESNESSPLVISIANLDKVTLSKVTRDGSVASSGLVSTFVRPDGSALHTITTGEGFSSSAAGENAVDDTPPSIKPQSPQQHQIEPIVETITSYSSEIHVVKKRVPRRNSRKRRAQTKRTSAKE